MKDLAIIQDEISKWATYNFGANPIYQPTLGMVEELGEFFAACEQEGFGGSQSLRLAKLDALADGAIYAMNVCDKVRLRFIDLYNQEGPQDLRDREVFGALGMLSQAVLKHSQGIRKMDFGKLRERVAIAVSMWIRWAKYQAEIQRAVLHETIAIVWEQVQARDWVKNPAGPAPEEQGGSGVG